MQAAMLITMELRTQLQRKRASDQRPLQARSACRPWRPPRSASLRSIEAGETNVAGYLLLCVVAQQIEGLMQGVEKDKLARLLVTAAERGGEIRLLHPGGMAELSPSRWKLLAWPTSYLWTCRQSQRKTGILW